MARSIIAPAERVTNLRWVIVLLLGLAVLVTTLDRTLLAGERIGVFFLFFILAQIPMGIALDRFGVKQVVRVAGLLTLIGTLLGMDAANASLSRAASAFLGLGLAPVFPACAKAVGSWFPRSERGRATAIFDSSAKLANGLGLAFATWLAFAFGSYAMSWLLTALTLLFFGLFFFFYRNAYEDPRLTYAEANYIRSAGADGSAHGASAFNEMQLLGNAKVWGLSLGFAAYGYLFGFFLFWLPETWIVTAHVNLFAPSTETFAVWTIAACIDFFIAGLLVDRLIAGGFHAARVRKTLLLAGLVLGCSSLGLLTTADHVVAVVWTALAVAGLAIAAPIAWSLPAFIAPANTTGRIAATMNLFGSIAGVCAPIISARIAAGTGSIIAPVIVALLVLAGGIAAYTFMLGRIEPVVLEPA